MKIVRALLMILLVVAVFVAGFGYGRWYGKSAGGAAQKGGRKILYWVDPMHPAYKSDKPGIAPDCGMKLVPVYEGGEAASAAVPAVDSAAMPMGTIMVSPEKQQLIGVRYGEVEYGAGVHTFRADGKVAFDETRIARVHARVEGWIDQVFVDFTGQVVNKGQRLLTLYSPEMLATQQEYLLALKSKDMLKSSTLEDAVQQSNSLIAASHKRLELWDLSDAQIEEIARTGKPVTNITLNSPISGYVITRNAFPKQKITPETELYNVVDLSTVWIMADVFENEVPVVRLDQQATVSLAYIPGKSFRAKVNYIQPQMDPMTRTLKIRLEAENPEMLLKPDMYVDVEFRVQTPPRVTVPSEAVLNSGERKIVFVDRGNGYLEPRDVETGERIGDRLEILKGLKPGERIVISGNFLIDSESQLKAAAGGMAGMPGMPGMPEPTPKSGGSKPSEQPSQQSMPGMPGMPATPEPK
ncbi:MAG: efflux RND transporter periplasmic adaptor subunit [Acidobacteria bacterium]|nr:efflux RND transporter periplasmic adaptor subunit [Acidobacteriota bacterium]